jgi:hypothetical protein
MRAFSSVPGNANMGTVRSELCLYEALFVTVRSRDLEMEMWM